MVAARATRRLWSSLFWLLALVVFLVGCSSSGGGGNRTGGGCGDCPAETFMLPGDVPLEMVGIPAGTFMMGSTNGSPGERPVHKVTLSRNFQLGKFEVTKAQWEAVMGTTPWSGQLHVLDDPNSPAVYVSWHDTQTFIAALNSLTGETFGLPTEAEWEYACRAGTTTEYYFGDSSANLSDYAWWWGNANHAGERYAHVVGQLLPNAFGLFDMHGNVWEWCEDSTAPSGTFYYASSPAIDPPGPKRRWGDERIMRGGGESNDPSNCRSAVRTQGYKKYWSKNSALGFRLAR